jgi:uncharacterized RDD family membrane protein YckC/predicted nucleic acid-binding Zn ribbon protein
MPDPARIPDQLRERLDKQRKRQRVIRLTFPLTIGMVVVLMFMTYQAHTFAPTSRVVVGVPNNSTLWVLDQQFELAAQETAGKFALVRVDGDEVTTGDSFRGMAHSVAMLPDDRAGVVSGLRYLVFDLTEDGWPRKEIVGLGLNDPNSNPVSAHVNGVEWLVFCRGNEVFIRPLREPDVLPRRIHKAEAPRPMLQLRAEGDRLWLSVRDPDNNEVTLIAFTPHIERELQDLPKESEASDAGMIADLPVDIAPETDADAEAEAPPAPTGGRAAFRILHRIQLDESVRHSSTAILRDAEDRPVPVVAFNRKDETTWNIKVWQPKERKWKSADVPERDKPLSRLATNNFLTVTNHESRLLAFFNDGNDVKYAAASVQDGALEWDDAKILEIDGTRDTTMMIVMMSLMLLVTMLAMSQGAWMMLNRERPGDRALIEAIDRSEARRKDKEKADPKVYASGLLRAFALLVDVAMISPVVIVLQDVYGYEWLHAYGFLAIGAIDPSGSAILASIHATLVTLLVLVIYSSIAELIWGKTFGKALFRLHVVNADNERPETWRIIVRNAMKVVELIHWIVLIVPMVVMMVSGKQQRLGDLVAGTYVVFDTVAEESPDDMDV